jgi:hypothetical protein
VYTSRVSHSLPLASSGFEPNGLGLGSEDKSYKLCSLAKHSNSAFHDLQSLAFPENVRNLGPAFALTSNAILTCETSSQFAELGLITVEMMTPSLSTAHTSKDSELAVELKRKIAKHNTKKRRTRAVQLCLLC